MDIAFRLAVISLSGFLAAGSQPPADWKVFLRRVGPLTVGATLDEVRSILGDPNASLAQAVSRTQTLPREPENSPCAYLVTGKVPSQLGLMFQNGRLARVDIREPGTRSASGAEVGDTEARIRALYGSRITVTPHKYEPAGHYLVFTPIDAGDSDYQMLFETDGARVTRFRVGLRAAVAQVEGCA